MENKDYLEQANRYFTDGKLDEANEVFGQVLARQPDHPDAWHGLGLVAWMRGDSEQAKDAVQRAIKITPDSPIYLNTMGEVLRSCGDLLAAEETLLQILKVSPDYAQARNNLGMVYMSKREFSKSLLEFEQALELAPNLAMAHFNKGLVLKELNNLDGAISAYRKAIELEPEFVTAHVNLAIVLLLNGQLLEGFEEYEWRLRPEFARVAEFNQPRWDGLIDPKATLLVHTEQGFGDVIQFLRYLPFIASEGMRVIVQCPPELQNLIQSVEGVSMAYAFDEPLPHFDVHIPLLSIPFLFQTNLSKVPANVPYLSPSFEKVQYWRERLAEYGETVKIGLRWSGNPKNSTDDERSISLSLFEALAGLEQVTFISLQNQAFSTIEETSARKMGMVDVSDHLNDFVDTLALIENLNLVISVDTAVLHLAGALRRPVWGLLKYSPHWPWMLERDNSPWYPSMLLIRQEQRGDWAEVLELCSLMLTNVMRSSQEE